MMVMGIRAQECVAAELGGKAPGAPQELAPLSTGAAPIELLQAPLDVLHAPGSKKFGIFTLQAEISFSRALMEIVCLVNPNN